MANSGASNSAVRLTTRLPFFNCGDGNQYHLFEVVDGIPISDALEQAFCILFAAHQSSMHLIETKDDGRPGHWAVYIQTELARALLESVFLTVKD